jgi:hypothetical protein
MRTEHLYEKAHKGKEERSNEHYQNAPQLFTQSIKLCFCIGICRHGQ